MKLLEVLGFEVTERIKQEPTGKKKDNTGYKAAARYDTTGGKSEK